MSILLLTITQTGTHFMMQEVLRNYDKVTKPDGGKTTLVQRHLPMLIVDEIEVEHLLKSYTCIATLRHPLATMQSWKNVGQSLPRLTHQYRLLVKYIAEFNLVVLPIDSPRREHWLVKASRQLDNLSCTDWPIVRGNRNFTFKPLTQLEFESAQEIVKSHHDMFAAYGYEV